MLRISDMIKTSFYIGATGYGGPAILAHMKTIIVQEKKWISEKQFMDGLGLAQVLPGAIGVTLMGYLGFKFRKYLGALIMPFFFALPALLLITVLSWAYFRYGQLPFVKSLFMGLGAMVISLLLNALANLGKTVFPKLGWNDYKGFAIALISFAGIFFLHINIIILILFSGFLGFIFYYFTGEFESINRNRKQESVEVITEEASTMKNRIVDTILPIAVFLLLVGGMIVSPARVLFGEFFKIGMLAFGGGFTSIPLMQHVIVDAHHWVDLLQFRDGIAMGQITPGPVLITAAFIGYKLLGAFGAIVATAAIFMPSLLAILALGAFHNKIKNLILTKVIIKGFLAGFLGLILATTINFGISSLINWQTWSIFVISSVVLLYFKKDPLWVILGTIAVSFVVF